MACIIVRVSLVSWGHDRLWGGRVVIWVNKIFLVCFGILCIAFPPVLWWETICVLVPKMHHGMHFVIDI